VVARKKNFLITFNLLIRIIIVSPHYSYVDKAEILIKQTVFTQPQLHISVLVHTHHLKYPLRRYTPRLMLLNPQVLMVSLLSY